MRFFYLFLSLLSLINSNKIIKNVNLPSCRNCKFFTPSHHNSNFNSPFHNCEKFGEKNILTGDIEYKSASYCRKDEQKCGEQGKYFEQEPNLKFKMFKHFAVSSLPNALTLIVLCLALIVVTLKNTK